jgi:hypothetical protein
MRNRLLLSRFLIVTVLALAATAAVALPKLKPATTLTITNGREKFTAVEVVVRAGKGTVRLPTPLESKAEATMKLPVIKGCMVNILAAFRYESTVEIVEIDQFDICEGTESIAFTFADPPSTP